MRKVFFLIIIPSYLIAIHTIFFPPIVHGTASQIQGGFGIFLSPIEPLQDIERFKSDIDDSVIHNLQWVRTGIASWDVAPSGSSSGQINWNYQKLAYYDQAIEYARQKGLKIVLVVSGAPDWTTLWGNNYSFEDYQKVSVNYLRFLAERYTGKIAIWQVFNEANLGHYRYFTPITPLTSDYLSQLNSLLTSASQAIKSADPQAHITTTYGSYPMNDQQQVNWYQYFDGIGSSLDEISLDLYPVNNVDEINKLGNRVSETAHRYSKPVFVGETGIQTCTECWGGNAEQIQQQYLPMAINQLKTGSPYLIFVYQMRDRGTNLADGESTFGIKYNDGRPKPGYAAVMQTMQGAFPSDLNTDGKVDIDDYNLLVASFGNPYTIFDYNQLVANFGKTN